MTGNLKEAFRGTVLSADEKMEILHNIELARLTALDFMLGASAMPDPTDEDMQRMAELDD